MNWKNKEKRKHYSHKKRCKRMISLKRKKKAKQEFKKIEMLIIEGITKKQVELFDKELKKSNICLVTCEHRKYGFTWFYLRSRLKLSLFLFYIKNIRREETK